MKTLKLGEVCTIIIGRTPSRSEQSYWGKGNRWAAISDLNSKLITETKEEITDYAVAKTHSRRIKKGMLLLSFKLTIGKVAFAGVDLFTNEAIAALELKNTENLHNDYLYYVLLNTNFKSHNQAVKGKTLNSKSLKEIPIPLPPLVDQIKIATLLGKVETLIAQRKHHLTQLDELLKSVFLDLFGDPITNEKGWKKSTIGNLAHEIKYGTSAPAKGGEYTYLRMNNITREGNWDFTSVKYIDSSQEEFDKYSVKKGDLVFNRTNSKELVGKTAIYTKDKPAIIAGYLIRVRFNSQTNPWFVWGHLNSKHGKQYLFKLCRNIVGMANINTRELRAIPILNPPLTLQNYFARIVEKVETLKSGYEHSLRDLEYLYRSLSHHAFTGQIDLSRVRID